MKQPKAISLSGDETTEWCLYTEKQPSHSRVGHVFQGRYKAILVEKDSYLLELPRYIVLNPLRARMVKNVADWEWSSYHAMINPTIAPGWLETGWILSCFSKQKKRAIDKYIDFVRAGTGLPSVWENLKYQSYLGEVDFVEGMRNKLNDKDRDALKEVSRLQRRPISKSLKWYQQKAGSPKEAVALAYLSGDYSMKEIAGGFGVHYSTVSRAVKSYEMDVDA